MLLTIEYRTKEEFQYDPFGRRINRIVGSSTAKFLYDDYNRVQELSGSTVTANLLNGPGIDAVLTRTDTTGPRNFLTDGLGSLRLPITSEDYAVTASNTSSVVIEIAGFSVR